MNRAANASGYGRTNLGLSCKTLFGRRPENARRVEETMQALLLSRYTPLACQETVFACAGMYWHVLECVQAQHCLQHSFEPGGRRILSFCRRAFCIATVGAGRSQVVSAAVVGTVATTDWPLLWDIAVLERRQPCVAEAKRWLSWLIAGVFI